LVKLGTPTNIQLNITMGPQFSILVPTRQRPDTLASTLATLVTQAGDDYEIVVADNFGDAEVAKVIAEAQRASTSIKHVRSSRVLPMAENWENGLAACSGAFVTVLGDDDGFMPSTLATARKLLTSSGTKVLSWNVHTYWWPNTIAYWNANRLYVSFANSVEWRHSRSVLLAFFRDELTFGALPTIYSAFVHRDIINTARNKYGRYFVAPELSPDVTSAIINLIQTERFLHSNHALAVRGNSKNSTGTAHWARAFGKEQRETYLKEENRKLEELSHPNLIPSPNLGFAIANLKLFLKELLFSDDRDIEVDRITVVKSAIANLNFEPESYDDNLADALQLADKLGFNVDPNTIPPKLPLTTRDRYQGAGYNQRSELSICVNCDQAKIFNVAEAACIAEAISSPPTLTISGPIVANATTGYVEKRVNRNSLCPCGSGKRYKLCHGRSG
jgi:glycosyltransferase involved in cell wall biosynthesis